jgi:Zn-dependent protease with chaperone function
MENEVQNPLQILIALSALPVVLFALWAEYYSRQLEELKASRETEGAAIEAHRVRSAGLFSLMLQALFFLTTADLRKDLPLYLHFFPIVGISIQTWLQAGLERKIREAFKKQATFEAHLRGGPGFFRAFSWALVAGAVYLFIMIGSLATATGLAAMLHANAWFSTGFMALGLLVGVLGGLGLNFALGPFYLKQVLRAQPIDDPDLRGACVSVFERARLPIPEFLRAEAGQSMAGAMMTGIRAGRGMFRPAVFVTEALLSRLSAEELRAVLAHEASHMALSHLRRRFVYSASLIVGISALSTILVVFAHVVLSRTGAPEASHWVGLVCGVFAFSVAFKLLATQNRRHELESDLFCVERLEVSVETLASALRKLEPQDPYSRVAGMGHPPTEARIIAVRAKLALKAAAAPVAPSSPAVEEDRHDRAA